MQAIVWSNGIFEPMTVEVNNRRQAQQFYNETRQWQSELNSLIIDLMFFERILSIYALKITDPTESRDVHLLQQTLKSFVEHRAENQKERLKNHQEYLQRIIEDRVLLKDRELPYKHQDIQKDLADFRVGGGSLKKELYEKVERLKNF